MPRTLIAIAPFIVSCPGVITLGVRPALCDYSPEEKQLINSAETIFFPTPRFAEIFEAAGEKTFPNAFTYQIRKSRVVEAALLQFSGFPHCRIRVYFGRQKEFIANDFGFPMIAMGPNRSDSARIIENPSQLADAAGRFNPLIIREYIEYEERMLLVFTNYECIAEFGGLPGERGYSSSIKGSAEIPLYPLLSDLLRSFKLCDIAVEVGRAKNGALLIDSFARPPVYWETQEGTVNRHDYISGLIQSGMIF